jgi:hypothetical protein
MATWRCPNCRTAQSESAARCFLCNRSATSCGTCANFRGSVVGGVGFCAIDRRREPLTGAEQRDCWSSSGSAGDDGLFGGSQLPIAADAIELAPAPLIEARVTPR